MRLAEDKTNKYLSLPNHQLAENLVLVFTFYKRTKKKKNKPQFVIEIAGIIVTIFSYKNVSQTASKTFAKQCSLY